MIGTTQRSWKIRIAVARRPCGASISPGQGELDPDGEQQQDDADLGEGLDGVHVPHQPQRVGAEQQPRDNEAGEGREAEPVEHQDHQHRNREDDGEILQQADLHGRASRRKWIERCYLVW